MNPLFQKLYKIDKKLFKILKEFRNDIKEHYKNIIDYDVKIGYASCIIKHYFHGSKKNRKYLERNEILKQINAF